MYGFNQMTVGPVLFDYRSVVFIIFFRYLRTIDVYFHQGCFFAQERVAAAAVDARERRSKTGNDAPDLGGFRLFGLFNAFSCDETVVDGAESEQFHLVPLLEVDDDIALVTIQDIQYIPFSEGRFFGNLLGGIGSRECPIIKGRRFKNFFPWFFTRNAILADQKCLWHTL